MRGVLGDEERMRVERFRFARERQLFIVRRSSLRLILAAYLGESPGQLQYRIGPFGKPALAQPPGSEWLRFSASQSADRAVIAVAREREVGVDLERIRPLPDLAMIALDILSPRELTVFQTLREAERLTSFLSVWTQKEAYLKARGFGLKMPLQDIEVGIPPRQDAGLRRDSCDPTAVDGWSVVSCEPPPGFLAAVAAEGRDWKVVAPPRELELGATLRTS
jgi:4'-phosphopantetheinyl transferase